MLYWCVNKMNLNESMFSGRNDSLVRLEQSLCTHNVTDKEESLVPPFLQCFSGLLGNILALIILIRSSKRHKWKPFYRLVCALALTDAIVSVFVYPVVLKTLRNEFWILFYKFWVLLRLVFVFIFMVRICFARNINVLGQVFGNSFPFLLQPDIEIHPR